MPSWTDVLGWEVVVGRKVVLLIFKQNAGKSRRFMSSSCLKRLSRLQVAIRLESQRLIRLFVL